MSDMYPTSVANQALDAAGVDVTIGDLEEGTREAQVCLRAYRQCLQQLLRVAHWDFARKTAPLVLLADATGNTLSVGTVVPIPWIYEYEYPIDCMKARYVPWNPVQSTGTPPGNISISTTVPLTTGFSSTAYIGQRVRPARFLVATDFNYPAQQGAVTWEVQGVSPQGRTVILTNVPNAQLVYTSLVLYPSVWDSLFRAAMVSYLAAEIALPLAKDKKLGLALRTQNMAIARQKVTEARVANGNEGWSNSDISVDWMRARNSGYGWRGQGGDGDGPGVLWNSWDSFGSDTGSSAY